MSRIPYTLGMNSESVQSMPGKRYFVELIASFIVYVLVLVASIALLKSHDFSPALRALIAVTPALPVIAVLTSIVRFVLSIDELQRQIHLEAMAISAAITAALSMTYAFLEGVGLPHSQAYWAFDCLMLGWALALPFVRKRYE